MCRDFVRSESGAITVDWVVITALVITLASGAYVLYAQGVTQAAETTNTNMQDSVTKYTSG